MTNGFTPEPTTSMQAAPRPMYWAVRREIWENRSVYIAPLIVAAVVLFGTFVSIATVPSNNVDPAKQRSRIVGPYTMAPAPIMLATFIVGMFYAVDALYGERRDRSVLFWKSLPVSDQTTVLAKAAVPIAVLPAIAFLIGVVTQVIVLILSTVVLTGRGVSPAPLWANARPLQEPLVQLYGLTVHALWFAPIYAWLLLVSAWAKRAAFLWAFLPWFAVMALERIFGGDAITSMVKYRFVGAMQEAFASSSTSTHPVVKLSHLTPGRYLSSAGLWAGLIFAAVCLVLAVKLRRDREPI